MESARKPQLSDLRLKRLAYFDQHYPQSPSPPSKEKPSTTNSPLKTNGQTERNGPKTSSSYGATTYSQTGAIPKSSKKTQHYFLDTNGKDKRNSRKGNRPESNGISYQQVAEKRKSTMEMINSEEFEISNDVEEIFRSHKPRSRANGSVDKVVHLSTTKPPIQGSYETASSDYEAQLRNHLQKPHRQGLNVEITRKSKAVLKRDDASTDVRDYVDSRTHTDLIGDHFVSRQYDSRDNSSSTNKDYLADQEFSRDGIDFGDQGDLKDPADYRYHLDFTERLDRGDKTSSSVHREHLDSRKKHLKKYIYRQDDAIVQPAVRAADDHSAVYAQNILHQMTEVRQMRNEMHGELLAGSSHHDPRMKPVAPVGRQEPLSSEKAVEGIFTPMPSSLKHDVRRSWKQQVSEEGEMVDVIPSNDSVHLTSKKVSKHQSPSFHSSDLDKNDGGGDTLNVPQGNTSSESLENDMTFDLGALQEAAKQGDEILRKYIQSLSKNLKKKKLAKETSSSRAQHNLESNNRGFDEEDVSFSEPAEGPLKEKSSKSENHYTPKVSQPAITSRELEGLGLFEDLRVKSNLPQPSSHQDSSELDNTWEDEVGEEIIDQARDDLDEDLGLSTHRPQERPFSPLKQVTTFNEVKPARDQEFYGTESSFKSTLDASDRLRDPELPLPKKSRSRQACSLNSQSEQEEAATCNNIDDFFSTDKSLRDDKLENKQGHSKTKEKSSSVSTRAVRLNNLDANTNEDILMNSAPLPLPLGTEIGNFLCSEQSTDSDPDRLTKSGAFKPRPPNKERKSSQVKRHKPKNSSEALVRNPSPRRPKTPERHVDGVREHHERRRDHQKKISPRKSQIQQVESSAFESNKLTLGKERVEKDDLMVEDIFKTSQSLPTAEPLLVGPAGDAPKLDDVQNQNVKTCPECNGLNTTLSSSCQVCGAVFLDGKSRDQEGSVLQFVDKLDLSAAPAYTDRTDMTTGSAWDIQVSQQVQDEDLLRKGADNVATVMGKIANFVPRLSIDGGGDFQRVASPGVVEEVLGGQGNGKSVKGGDLPTRVDAWLAANETGRRSKVLDMDPNNPDSQPAAHEVTFDLPHQDDVSKLHVLNENGRDRQLKPRPSSAGPQRSSQGVARPKSSTNKSRTGQLIDSPMYNRRWATSSSTWGSRRSVGDGLQASGQRLPLADSLTASGSPLVQTKRPASAKSRPAPPKGDIEPGVRGHKSRPKSASWRSRESKDVREGQSQEMMKEEFLAVNSAQLKEGLASRALNTSSSHNIPPLTLQLMCDSPRGGEGLSIWELLPDEILLHIFSYLSFSDLIQCAVSCSRFHRIAMDDTLWRTIGLHKRQVTDFWLTQIGERHPVSLSITQCHGNIVTENGLRNLFRSCADSLQELNVSGCTGGDLTGDSLLLHASRCQYLTSLDASWCQVTDNGLAAISDSCKRLTSLCLNGCQSVSDECLRKVITRHGKSLQVLEVLGCLQLSPETLRLIGKECRHLRTLNIGQCYRVTDDCISVLAGHLRNLQHLDLRGCKQIRDSCIRKIVRNCKRLINLVLANCNHITNAAIIEIATYLSTIRSLDVSGCKKVNNEGVRSLATCCHHLTSLDVSSTGVDHKSVSALASYCNKTLVSARFNCCKDITEAATIKLLKNCKKLKTLHLYGVKGLRNLGVLKQQYPCLQFG
ncbi:uncharacterized protein LOC117305872 [Asterias rubens]|uniref:uncharacterized protein LOC117305872 n=1 Tax=Asterias rubens TaxID=7604 RepID=UPI001455CBA2|nr:uncharacterized protein LOC117305872 [Asterias rubens]